MLNSKSETLNSLETLETNPFKLIYNYLKELKEAPLNISSIREDVLNLFKVICTNLSEEERKTEEAFAEAENEEEVELMDDGTPANLQH